MSQTINTETPFQDDIQEQQQIYQQQQQGEKYQNKISIINKLKDNPLQPQSNQQIESNQIKSINLLQDEVQQKLSQNQNLSRPSILPYESKFNRKTLKSQTEGIKSLQEKLKNKQLEKQKTIQQQNIFNKISLFQKHDGDRHSVIGRLNKSRVRKTFENTMRKSVFSVTIKEETQEQKNQRLLNAIKDLDEQVRFDKAQRHFYDAFYFREVRHDIDQQNEKKKQFLCESLFNQLQGVYKSLEEILVLLIIIFIVLGAYAFIGVELIGDLGNEVQVDTFAQDMSKFEQVLMNLYILSTLDLYPDIMIPSYNVSKYYLLYWISFVLLFLLVFVPIPVAVVYEAFKEHRVQQVVKQKITQKHALLVCFVSIDFDTSGSIELAEFLNLMEKIYKHRYKKSRFEQLFYALDDSENGSISVEEFFYLVDLIEQSDKYSLHRFIPPMWFKNLQKKISKKINLQRIIQSLQFNIFMFVINFLNCIQLIMQIALYKENNKGSIFIILDLIFLAFYIIEFVTKLLGQGIRRYFRDSWNKLDFTLIIMQICFDVILKEVVDYYYSDNDTFNPRQIVQIFRFLRCIRVLKFVFLLINGSTLLNKIINLIDKIVLIIPQVFNVTSIILVLFYVYAVIGVEVFSSQNGIQKNDSPYGLIDCSMRHRTQIYNFDPEWGSCEYATFDTIGGSFLILFQVTVAAGWSYIIYDYGYKFDNLAGASIYFISFYFFSTVLLALLAGLIWEIFVHIGKMYKDKEISLLQQQNEQDELNQQNNINFDNNNLQNTQNNNKQNQPVSSRKQQQNKKLTQILKQKTEVTTNLFDMQLFFGSKNIFKSEENLNTKKQNKDVQKNTIDDISKKYALKNVKIQKELQQQQNEVNFVNNQYQNQEISNSPTQIQPKNRLNKFLTQNTIGQRNNLNNYMIKQQIIDKFEPISNEQLNLFKNQEIMKNHFRSLKTQFLEKQRDKNRRQTILEKTDITKQNDRFIQNQALLQTKNDEDLKIIEENQIKNQFGNAFINLKEFDYGLYTNNSAKIVYTFYQNLKFPYLNINSFLHTLNTVEKEVSKNIYSNLGGVFQFVFKYSSHDMWFSVSNCTDEIEFHKQTCHLYENINDILYQGKSYEQALKEFQNPINSSHNFQPQYSYINQQQQNQIYSANNINKTCEFYNDFDIYYTHQLTQTQNYQFSQQVKAQQQESRRSQQDLKQQIYDFQIFGIQNMQPVQTRHLLRENLIINKMEIGEFSESDDTSSEKKSQKQNSSYNSINGEGNQVFKSPNFNRVTEREVLEYTQQIIFVSAVSNSAQNYKKNQNLSQKYDNSEVKQQQQNQQQQQQSQQEKNQEIFKIQYFELLHDLKNIMEQNKDVFFAKISELIYYRNLTY